MDRPLPPWDMRGMAARKGKKEEAERRARAMYARLMAMKPEKLSDRQWALQAGVNTSFFTNLQKGSEPSIGNLRTVLEAIGSSLPEFFVHEARGRLLAVPNEPALAAAFRRVLPGLPKGVDRQARFLAAIVADVVGLPPDMRSIAPSGENPDSGDHAGAAPARAATK